MFFILKCTLNSKVLAAYADIEAPLINELPS